jgi:hypothetical protein
MAIMHIRTLNLVSVAGLPVFLVVSGVRVLNGVVERVFWMRL